ncbi:MAG: hypothetical protein ACI8P3_003631 [Saprospiraceae bacterium]|jgi:hypothetical protein
MFNLKVVFRKTLIYKCLYFLPILFNLVRVILFNFDIKTGEGQ